MKNKPIKRILAIAFTIVLIFFLILICTLLVYSSGKIGQHFDSAGKPILGSMAEKTFIKIGGAKQGMFIRSKNIDNPILLYLRSGSAFPNYFGS